MTSAQQPPSASSLRRSGAPSPAAAGGGDDSTAGDDTVARPSAWRAAWSLGLRELVRFFRQRNRIVGAVGQPLVFWLLFGAGLGPSFRLGGQAASPSFAEYFFPGILVLIVLFTAIFATVSIIEDRREGFLQAVLVAPIPRWSMVLGKLWGGTAIAVIQALVFLALGLLLGPWLDVQITIAPSSLLPAVLLLCVLGLALTGLGFVLAWGTDSIQGFHAVMGIFLLPLWLLSGAFFPAGTGPLGWIVRLNPLSYGVAGLRHLLADSPASQAALSGLPSPVWCWTVTGLFALVMFALSCAMAAKDRVANAH